MTVSHVRTGRTPRAATPASEVVRVRATAEERASWLAAAGDESLSEWIRDRLNASAKRVRP